MFSFSAARSLSIFLFVLATCIALPYRASTASADSINDFYIRQALERYFILPQDARALSMSGSSALTCNDSSCIYLNPAGLGELKRTELSGSAGFSIIGGDDFLTESKLEQNEYHGYFVAAFPIGKRENDTPRFGTIDFGFSRYDGHTDDSIHTTPDGHRRSIAYGYSPMDSLSLGYSFNFYDDQLRSEFADLHSHSRLLHIWGITFRPADDLAFGLLYKLGIGQSDTEDFRFDSNGLSHLRSYTGSIGVTKTFDAFATSLAFDYLRVQSRGNLDEPDSAVVIGGDESGNVYNIRTGGEYFVTPEFTLRAGVRWHYVESYTFERADLVDLGGTVEGLGVTAGFGYSVRKDAESKPVVVIDYGVEYLNIGRGAWEHLVTVRVPLDI